jgi:hypothetical protein
VGVGNSIVRCVTTALKLFMSSPGMIAIEFHRNASPYRECLRRIISLPPFDFNDMDQTLTDSADIVGQNGWFRRRK